MFDWRSNFELWPNLSSVRFSDAGGQAIWWTTISRKTDNQTRQPEPVEIGKRLQGTGELLHRGFRFSFDDPQLHANLESIWEGIFLPIGISFILSAVNVILARQQMNKTRNMILITTNEMFWKFSMISQPKS
jgi:hypothetical protein